MKYITKYQSYLLLVVWNQITSRSSLSAQALLICLSSLFWDFWIIKILIVIKIVLFLFSSILLIIRNARLINYQFKMLLFEFAPSYFLFPIFENPQNNANNAINSFVILRNSEPVQSIGDRVDSLKLEAKEIVDKSNTLYQFEPTNVGTYLINDREMSEVQINNTLASYRSKLLPEKPSPTIVEKIRFWEEVKRKVLEIKTNKKAVIDHNFKLESS